MTATGSVAAPVRERDDFAFMPHRLLLMSDSLETGGSERQFAALAKGLDRRTFQVSLACIQNRGAFLEGLGAVETFPLGGSLYKLASWKTRARLARYLQNNSIEIAHAFDFYTNLTLVPAAYWARIPVIIGSQRQLGDLLTAAQFQAQLMAFRLCDVVVCNSQAAANRLCAAGLPSQKTVVIPNGLPAEIFARVDPPIPRTPKVPRIGMVARMNAVSKNHSGLLKALAIVREELPNVEALLAGDGPLRSQLEEQARSLGLSRNVQFLGDRRDVPAVLASVDVSVLPSLSESLSNSILESMAQGVPVIAARVGGNEELLGNDRGILVAPGDDAALARAIVDLVRSEPLRKTMGALGKSYAAENYSIENMSRRHEELYLRLLDRR